MAATTPVIAVCGVEALHVLAKAAGACDSNAAAGSLEVCGDGDRVAEGAGGAGEGTAGPGGVSGGGGGPPGKKVPKGTRAFLGNKEKKAKAARPGRGGRATSEENATR